jgi:predicted dehydrogenase/threonine dehydrogenase-like Zn-dependent dehydrogenase
MKQLLQHARTGEISVAEVPVPQLLRGCVLVQVAASVISSGTERAAAEFAGKGLLQKAKARPDLIREVIGKVQRDGIGSALQAVRSRLDQPQTPGYSSAGSVVAVGEGVTDLQPGDRVACAGAGFAVHAEVACLPRLLVARIPARPSAAPDVPFEEAAFATLGAVALHGIRTAEVKLGDLVAVIGLGLLGQLTAQLLKAAGCRVLGMDIDAGRAQLAKRFGADAVAASVSDFRVLCLEYSQGLGVDSVLITAETASSDPVNLAGEVARDRAIVVAVGTVGMEIERQTYYEKELDFRISRSYGPGRYDAAYEQKGRDYPIGYVRWTESRNMEAFLRLLCDEKLNIGSLITHRFPVERASAAYELITGRSREPFLGVVLQYTKTLDFARTLHLVRTPQAILPAASASAKEICVGVLGAGAFAAGTLLPAIKGSGTSCLVGVCAATGANAHHVAKKFGFAYCTTDDTELIEDFRINTVVIATRHHLHSRQVLAALGKHKHIFCEKPLCLSEDELRAIIRAYFGNASPLPVLTVGFNRRWAPMTRRIKSFLGQMSESLAMHYRINAGYLPPDHWVNDREQGGGRILGEVCHFVDLLMFLAGSPIVEVEAHTVASGGRYSGDNIVASLRFGSGSEGIITYLANGDRSFPKERLEVFGGGSVAVLDDFRLLELARDGRKQTMHSRWRQNKGHRDEWTAFQQAILGEQGAAIDFQELVCSTLATLRIQESVVTGKRLTVNTQEFIDAALHSSSLNQ